MTNELGFPTRLKAADKRAVDAAWDEVLRAGNDDDNERVQDMLRRHRRRLGSKPAAMLEILAFIARPSKPNWDTPTPLVEASLFGEQYAAALDAVTMKQAVDVYNDIMSTTALDDGSDLL